MTLTVPIWRLGRALREVSGADVPRYGDLLAAAKAGRFPAHKELAPGGGMRWAVQAADLEAVANSLGLKREVENA